MKTLARRRGTGIAIRAGGLALLALAWLSGRALWVWHAHPASPATLLFALATFVAATTGAAMLVLGPHLLDTVELSENWRRRA
ncbi:MAG: hypothetical protein WDN44_08755 [Sphingomonas sp.]